MDIDVLSWVLPLILLAFALGWLASRIDFAQLKFDNKQSPKAYFKGLNLLLNEQHDAAVDAFVEAVQNDPDTSELHFALGNLFRRRGEYSRAVRIHEHLVARADLTEIERERAQYALAQDYLKAGLLNFAEEALKKLDNSSYENSARLNLLAIYERSRDWSRSLKMAEKLENQNIGSFAARRSHFLCEMAANDELAKQDKQALEKLDQSIQIQPNHARSKIQKALLLKKIGQLEQSFALIEAVAKQHPHAFPLIAPTVVEVAQSLGCESLALSLLQENYRQVASSDVLKALVSLEPQHARSYYIEHLKHHSSMVAAAAWLHSDKTQSEVLKTIDKVTEPLTRYRCAACGFSPSSYFWQCPGCLNWDSISPQRIEEL